MPNSDQIKFQSGKVVFSSSDSENIPLDFEVKGAVTLAHPGQSSLIETLIGGDLYITPGGNLSLNGQHFPKDPGSDGQVLTTDSE